MQSTPPASRQGPLALVGSGEYLPAMEETDRYLLDLVGGPERASVALLPTASGLEPGRPAYWNDLGLAHFCALGVTDVRATAILDAGGAHDPAQVELLRGATFYYLSGGDPVHLIESLRDSPAWSVIAEAHANGAVLAGCSAGAMAFGARTISPRQVFAGGQAEWSEALGVVPGIAVIPHFDRMRGIRPGLLEDAGAAASPDLALLGIDEDTALVLSGGEPGPAAIWRVMGRRSVTVFRASAGMRVYSAGEDVAL